jgi:hypothetical protein
MTDIESGCAELRSQTKVAFHDISDSINKLTNVQNVHKICTPFYYNISHELKGTGKNSEHIWGTLYY